MLGPSQSVQVPPRSGAHTWWNPMLEHSAMALLTGFFSMLCLMISSCTKIITFSPRVLYFIMRSHCRMCITHRWHCEGLPAQGRLFDSFEYINLFAFLTVASDIFLPSDSIRSLLELVLTAFHRGCKLESSYLFSKSTPSPGLFSPQGQRWDFSFVEITGASVQVGVFPQPWTPRSSRDLWHKAPSIDLFLTQPWRTKNWREVSQRWIFLEQQRPIGGSPF